MLSLTAVDDGSKPPRAAAAHLGLIRYDIINAALTMCAKRVR